MDRNQYDLSHLSHNSLAIGRLQTISVIPVEAGASLEINMDSIARLAPNRKEIVSECQIDVCAFFVPHRIVYGQAWIDFINGGPDESQTFTGISIGAAYRNPVYLTLPTCGASINRALLEGYNRIFHNFYAPKQLLYSEDSNVALVNDYTWYPTTETGADNCRLYGRLCARLPHILNGGSFIDAGGVTPGWEAQDLSSTDSEVTVTAGVFTIQSLAQVQSRYKTEAQAAWFAHFYQDVMREKFGSDLGPDVDPRNLMPHMLMRHTQMMSGTDIDGTDDATLGTFQGKTLERVGFHMPRKFFGEHGNVFILACMRYPLVHTREQHRLLANVNPSYDEIVADPERLRNLGPVQWDPGAWLAGGAIYAPSGATLEPYGQHYRFQPNRVHTNFQTIPGYPFSDWNGTGLVDWYYYQNNEYKDTFQTTQIGQGQMQCLLNVQKYSPVPSVEASIFAGT